MAENPGENPGEMVLPEEVEDSQNAETMLVSRRQKRLSKRERRRLEESSNAAICPAFHFAKLNSRLNKPDGESTVVAWIIRIVTALTGVITLVIGDRSGAFDLSASSSMALFAVTIVGLAICAPPLSAFIVEYLRRVVQPTEHLAMLGAGRVKISARAATALERARNVLRVAKLFFMTFGGGVGAMGTFFFVSYAIANAHTFGTLIFGCWFILIGMWMGLVFPLIFDWWLTLKVASALAADATVEVVNVAQTISPRDPEWLQKVAEPAKSLALDTMDELSHGWGRALAVAYALFWIFAVALFAWTLSWSAGFPQVANIFLVVAVTACMYIPIAMSMDPASVSTSCDDFLAELNVQRSNLLDNEASINQIMRLEDVSALLPACMQCFCSILIAHGLTAFSSTVPRSAQQQTRPRLLGQRVRSGQEAPAGDDDRRLRHLRHDRALPARDVQHRQ
jgi:hypothetical protein